MSPITVAARESPPGEPSICASSCLLYIQEVAGEHIQPEEHLWSEGRNLMVAWALVGGCDVPRCVGATGLGAVDLRLRPVPPALLSCAPCCWPHCQHGRVQAPPTHLWASGHVAQGLQDRPWVWSQVVASEAT